MAEIQIPQIGSPFLDPSGRVTRPWWLFLQGMLQRVGGVTGSSTDDLVMSLPEDAGIEEIKADLYTFRQEQLVGPGLYSSDTPKEDPSARIEALEALVSDLASQIDDLKKGTLA